MDDQNLIGKVSPTPKAKAEKRRCGGYSAVSKDPEPKFKPAPAIIRPRFCRQLMKKARTLTSGYRFTVTLLSAKTQGKLKRMPDAERLTSMHMLLQGLCFYFDPATNSVQRSLTELAPECGLAMQSESGLICISRASRALQTLEDVNYIVLGIGADGHLNILFTPSFFDALNVRLDHLRAARLKAERVQRKKGTP